MILKVSPPNENEIDMMKYKQNLFLFSALQLDCSTKKRLEKINGRRKYRYSLIILKMKVGFSINKINGGNCSELLVLIAAELMSTANNGTIMLAVFMEFHFRNGKLLELGQWVNHTSSASALSIC